MLTSRLVVGSILLLLAGCDSDSQGSDATPFQNQSVTTAENSDAACQNRVDDDRDGYADCDDSDCQHGSAVTVCQQAPEDSQVACHDGRDNDNDGMVDCRDAECLTLGCTEDNDAACQDGIDNDGNNYKDCSDFSCKYGCNVTVCGAGEKTLEACTDGIDNDADRRADCADLDCQKCVPACQGTTGENTLELCSDGEDNDSDSATDCRDSECIRITGMTGCDTGVENTAESCSDGVDNDNDPYVDCADFNCSNTSACGSSSTAEDTDAACSDGIDNDNDRYVDCNDFNCSRSTTVTVCGNTPAPTVPSVTIHAIQDETDAHHVSIASGQTSVKVKLVGVTVSSGALRAPNGRFTFYVQDVFPPADTRFSGIEVYAGNTEPAITAGQLVNIVGNYQEFNGVSQISLESIEQVGEGTAPVATAIDTASLSGAITAESYEGVLLALHDVDVVAVGVQSSTGTTPRHDDFSVRGADLSESSPALVVSTKFVTKAPEVGEHYATLTGPLTYAWEMYRLVPRNADDYVSSAP